MTLGLIEKYLWEMIETIFSKEGAKDKRSFTGRHFLKEKSLD
jgi:hypothetical protein